MRYTPPRPRSPHRITEEEALRRWRSQAPSRKEPSMPSTVRIHAGTVVRHVDVQGVDGTLRILLEDPKRVTRTGIFSVQMWPERGWASLIPVTGECESAKEL